MRRVGSWAVALAWRKPVSRFVSRSGGLCEGMDIWEVDRGRAAPEVRDEEGSTS